MALTGLGLVMEHQGLHDRARSIYDDGLQIMRELQDTRGIAILVCNLADTAEQQGEYQRATELYEESLELYQELGDSTGIAGALVGMGAVASHQAQHRRAILLVGAAATIATSIGISLEPLDRARSEMVSQRARTALTAHAYEAAWNQGAAMSLKQVVEYALDQQKGV